MPTNCSVAPCNAQCRWALSSPAELAALTALSAKNEFLLGLCCPNALSWQKDNWSKLCQESAKDPSLPCQVFPMISVFISAINSYNIVALLWRSASITFQCYHFDTSDTPPFYSTFLKPYSCRGISSVAPSWARVVQFIQMHSNLSKSWVQSIK